MNFKQLSFYNSVLEFFSIILPGFVVTLIFFTKHWEVLVKKFLVDDEFQTFYFNLVFLLLSYVIGQALFQVGSIMDKLTYDRFESLVFLKKDRNLEKIKQTRKNLFRTFEKSIIERKKSQFDHMNNFQWSLSYLRQNDNDAYADMEKIMADSKFFRSIFSATVIYLFYYAWIHRPSNLSLIITLLIISYIFFFILSECCLRRFQLIQRKLQRKLKLKMELKIFKYCWIGISLLLLLYSQWHFVIEGLKYTCTNEHYQLLFFEICGEYNNYIIIISLISLILYFRIRKKCISRTYKQVIYNLKLKI